MLRIIILTAISTNFIISSVIFLSEDNTEISTRFLAWSAFWLAGVGISLHFMDKK